jgi:hypothetical protein
LPKISFAVSTVEFRAYLAEPLHERPYQVAIDSGASPVLWLHPDQQMNRIGKSFTQGSVIELRAFFWPHQLDVLPSMVDGGSAWPPREFRGSKSCFKAPMGIIPRGNGRRQSGISMPSRNTSTKCSAAQRLPTQSREC